MVLEFKIRHHREKDLAETIKNALSQIAEKNYDAELAARGIPKEKNGTMGLRSRESAS